MGDVPSRTPGPASSHSTRKPRILMLADDCNPEWHSLPALVYRYQEALHPLVDLTLVTQIRNRENIEKVRPPTLRVEYLDTESVAAPVYRLASWLSGDPNKAMTLKVALSYPSYLYFEWQVWRRFKERLRAGEFDVVHRASPMSPTIPSPIASLSPVPFVIGPLLGGLPWPAQFAPEMRREKEWMNYVRGAHRHMPFYQSTYAKAAAILAAYRHTIDDIPRVGADRIIDFSEGGIDPRDFPTPNKTPKERLQIVFVGRLVPFKCPEIPVRCFAASPELRKHQLIIVGDGPERPRLEQMIAEHGLADCVKLTGTLPHAEVVRLMADSEIFAFPSIREQGGGVITMAAMSEMACVVVDYGGPSVRVPDGAGIRVPMGTLDELVRRFTEVLEALVNDREQIKRYGQAARRFTEKHYAWDAKAKKTVDIYRWVMAERTEKPSFWHSDNVPA